MHPEDIRIDDYTYSLSDERVAKFPLPDKDEAKLLVYKDDSITEDRFKNIAQHIPANALMVFNKTKVIHARLLFKKTTGGVIEVFCLSPHKQYPDVTTAMMQRGQVYWDCMIGGASKWKHGMVLELASQQVPLKLKAKITERNPNTYTIHFEWDNPVLTFAEVLHFLGKIPLPPYLHRDAEDADEQSYQTLFAKNEGSVAAPTAGLHFTQNVLDSITAKSIHQLFLTLHVGAGTFKPVTTDTMKEHAMHEEWMEIDLECIELLTANPDKKVVAVGTTSLRTLESLYWIGNKLANNQKVDWGGIAVTQWECYGEIKSVTPHESISAILEYMQQNRMEKIVTKTQILIAPGYSFKIVDGLVTNFHQPKSTLLLLVAAFVGEKWKELYDYAFANDFRFLSYGDGSILWR